MFAALDYFRVHGFVSRRAAEYTRPLGLRDNAGASRDLVVGHYVGSFLPPTEGWIYDQLRYACRVQSIILTKRVLPNSEFTWPTIYSTERKLRHEVWRTITGFYPSHADACGAHHVQMIHGHFGNRAAFACELAAHLRVPLVASFYGRDLAKNDGYGRLFRQAARCIAEGPAARQRLIDLGCPPGKIRIHRLGINPDEIEFVPRIRRRDEPLRVLMAGRFVEKKGFIHGIRAFCAAAQRAPMTLTIVGEAGRAAAERRVKEALLREAGRAPEKITFHGFMTRAEFVAAARGHHVILQPSVSAADGDCEGGHPVVLTMLAAAGMPAVATRHCDIPEIVAEGCTGWLCDERDETGLAAALLQAYAADLEPMSRAARELVESKYDVRRETLDQAYEGIL
jgi:colanic acid/amylovoran biosynthesis glycosyltransferase